ncbi:hypothetical protein GF340_05895 [Candidatus Peregrinibacteria bacterium]|nr:hypothetical protein [Candidatus Peregrinibacteria bacterium]
MRIICIINPESGQDFPILSVLNRFFRKHNIFWDVHITGRETISCEDYDMALIYGGDGTISEYMQKIDIPVLALHGGTGNLIPKEIGIPAKVEDALELLVNPNIKKFDAFKFNNRRVIMRAYAGPPAEVMSNIKRDDKNRMGQLAYLSATLKSINYEPQEYTYEMDGETQKIKTNIIFVTNFSSLGFADFKLDKRINPQDGKLDLILMHDPLTLTRDHFHFKKISISAEKETLWAIDDSFEKHKNVNIEILPERIQLITP